MDKQVGLQIVLAFNFRHRERSMRQISIYRLGKETKAYAGEYHEFHQMDFDKIQPISYTDFALPMDMTVQVKREPVHHLVRVEQGRRQESYIVIEPKLRELLEAPFLTKVAAANREAAEALEHLKYTKESISNFLSLPWYKRIWMAIRERI